MTLRLQTLHGGAEVPGGAFRLTNEQIQVAEKLREGWTLWHDWSELEEGDGTNPYESCYRRVALTKTGDWRRGVQWKTVSFGALSDVQRSPTCNWP